MAPGDGVDDVIHVTWLTVRTAVTFTVETLKKYESFHVIMYM